MNATRGAPPTHGEMKCVGRRTDAPDPIRDAAILQRTLNDLRSNAVAPRGVFRFRTHEEADRWMTEALIRTRVRHTSKT